MTKYFKCIFWSPIIRFFFQLIFGIGYACIVDVGDQKTSVSCVEDGISHPDTRMHLDYGGSDITQVNIISFSAS